MTIRTATHLQILDIIRRQGPIGSRQIQGITGLSQPTVSRYLTDLLADVTVFQQHMQFKNLFTADLDRNPFSTSTTMAFCHTSDSSISLPEIKSGLRLAITLRSRTKTCPGSCQPFDLKASWVGCKRPRSGKKIGIQIQSAGRLTKSCRAH